MIKKLFSPKVIVFLAVIFSFNALYYSFINGYILTYNDAASHLNISRRVIDNLTPGIAQIGTVWLPLPHVLMLPFAANDFLWNTGLAGSIVSMAAYVLCVYFVFKLIMLITKSNIGAFMGASIMALNPNLLYLQTTPMTEPLLVAMIMMSLYFFAKYLSSNDFNDLILCGASVALSTLIRYDGWFLFFSMMILLPATVWKLYGRKKMEGVFILFSVSAGFGIFLWVLWNLMIFGDPLYFAFGPYSAYAQQRVLKDVGQLPTEGNLFNTLYYYFWAMVDNNGMILLLMAVACLLILPFIIKQKRYLVVILAVLSPIIFNIIALYEGQSAMNVPQALSNPGMFNIRYGLMALPAIAVIIGIICSHNFLRHVVLVLFIFQGYLFIRAGTPVSLADGLHGLNDTYYTVEASKWLRENYKGGLILTSLASHDAFVNRAQIPMKNYIHEGTRENWTEALRWPGDTVQYIAALSFPPDRVYKEIYNNESFKKNYKVIHSYGKFSIYERSD